MKAATFVIGIAAGMAMATAGVIAMYPDVSRRMMRDSRRALRQACGGADRQPVRLNALLCRKMRMAPASSAFVFCAGIRYNERMKNMSSNMEVRDDG